MIASPPRLARWLLDRYMPAEWREFAIGDLEEEFGRRAAQSPADASRWFWRQTARSLASASLMHRRGYRAQILYSPGSGDSMFRRLLADIRYALRVLFHAPSFALAVVVVLGLGIGANTAIFSIVNSVLLRPLPYDQPDRLVRLFHVPPQAAFPGIKRFSVSPANFYDWQRAAQSFEGMAIYRSRSFVVTGGGRAEALIAGALGAGFFEVVHARPALGRVFVPEEDRPGHERVVILSDGYWKTHFGAAPDVVGRTLTLDGAPYTIVGVMPARFSINSWGAASQKVWVPLAYTDERRAVRDNHNDAVVARLKRGVDLAHANAEMDAISKRLEEQYPKENAGWGATVVSLQELIVGDIRTTLVMLLASVALVLLIACANVGNLLFARGLGRRKELAIRSALGAGRARVFQQLLVEAVVLAVAGGALGLLLTRFALTAGGTFLANQIPRADEITLDTSVLSFALGVSLLTGLVAGVMPALRAGQTNLNDALKEGGRDEGAVGIRTRRALIVCEVALSVVLLMSAGVMIRSLAALRNTDAGFNPHNVLTLSVILPDAKYKEPHQRSAFYTQALARLRALPGVQDAGVVDDVPLQGGSVQPIVIEGTTERLPRDQPTVVVRKITPGYLRAMGIQLVQGRDVTDSDGEVMVITRGAAKLLWGIQNPIGQRATLPLESKTVAREVVGIVGDVKEEGLREAPMAAVYEFSRELVSPSVSFVLRTEVPPASVAQPAAQTLRALDPDQPLQDIKTMDEIVDSTLSAQRFSVLVLGLFAALALTLASVGIYSVLSYIVRGRSREIGIRTALGAGTRDVVRLVVVEGMTPTIVGIATGTIAALASGRLLEKLVFGVSATDPLTFASVAGLLAIVAMIASLVPAYRASRLDPVKVLHIC
jgi:putative ABC transport system permease protein